MDTDQKLAEAKIAAEDIIADLERLIARTRAATIKDRAEKIYAESPELFNVSYALCQTARAAAAAKSELLKAIGMAPNTRLTSSRTRG